MLQGGVTPFGVGLPSLYNGACRAKFGRARHQTPDVMANRSGREAIRGAEGETLQLIAVVLTSPQWAGLLHGALERATGRRNRSLARRLVDAGADGRANRNRREVLWGVEAQTFDLIAKALTSEQWAELLKGPLELTAGHGNRGLAKKLVEAGAHVGDALHEAIGGGHREVVMDLLESGASINAKEASNRYTPLHLAAGEGRTGILRMLILKGADKEALDNYGWTPLYTTAYCGRLISALDLLTAGADVNTRCGERNMSVVHIAAERGHVGILRAAIEHGADVKAADIVHRTALHYTADISDAEAIDVLVEAGADIEARDNNSWTPLHWAADKINLEALAALLKHGAHVNAQNDNLRTPLHCSAAYAGLHGAAEVVDLLLRAGAAETTVDDEGKTAEDVVAVEVLEGHRLAEDVGRVRHLLANAPADSAWRRRGYLVLCRARPGRVPPARGRGSAGAGMSRRTRSFAKLRRSEARGCDERVREAAADDEVRPDWTSVLSKVLGLQEEGIFRTIVGYL